MRRPGVTPPAGENVEDRLVDLRRSLGKVKAKDKKDKKAKKAKEAKKPKSADDKKKPAAAEDAPLWFGKRKPAGAAAESRSTSSSSESSGRGHARDRSRRGRKDGGARKTRKSQRVGDRGPFGTGTKVHFAKESGSSISSEGEAADGQVFQAAPSSKSKHLQLLEYAQKNPGRLASRLLSKMRTLLAREEGALSAEASHANLTPATATSYFLTVLIPLHRDRLNLQVQRELRTIARALDLVAMGTPERAADVLAQRMKALEMMIADQSWARAAHIELLPPEGATLVEPDESWVATKEHLQENKMKAWKGKGVGKESEGKGKARDDKGKGKKGQRWSNRTWGQAPAEAETGQAK